MCARRASVRMRVCARQPPYPPNPPKMGKGLFTMMADRDHGVLETALVGKLPTSDGAGASCPVVPAQERERYLDVAAARAGRAGKFAAEIGVGQARWHIVLHAPGQDNLAMAHLVGRGFGCYQPLCERKISRRGNMPATSRLEPIFRGYLFLLIWNVDAHMRRITSCPGVVGVLCRDGTPVTVPDQMITKIQAIECKDIADNARAAMKRPRKRDRVDLDFRATMSTRSCLTGIETLDADARIGLLAKALGLAS